MRLFAYGGSSASYRVRIALYHKQIPFELATVAYARGEHHGDEHRARNPLGQVPVLEIDDRGEPVYLAQSLAIIEYLEERFPARPLLPRDLLARARAREFAEIVNAGTQPLQNTWVLSYLRDELHADELAWGRLVIRRGLDAIAARARASAGRFLVGDVPSLADVCLVPQLLNARRFGVELDGLGPLLSIDERARALPGWELAHPDRQPDAIAVR